MSGERREVSGWPFSDETTQVGRGWLRLHELMDADAEATVPSAGKRDLDRLYWRYGERLRACAAEDLDGIPPHGHPETRGAAIRLYADPPAQRRLLDGGCGPNPVASLAFSASPKNRVVAMDIAYGTAAVAREFARRSARKIDFVVGDLEALPFRAGAFDVIVCDDTFEHLLRPGVLFAEFRRAVSARGEVFLTTPNRLSLHILYWKLKNLLRGRRLEARAYYMDRSHLREYSYRELRDLASAHFRIAEALPLGFGAAGWLRRLGTWLVARPALRGLSYFLMIRLHPR